MTLLSSYFEPFGCEVQHLLDAQSPGRYLYLISAPFINGNIAFQYDIVDIDDDFWKLSTRRLISLFTNDIKLDQKVNYNDKLIADFIKLNYQLLDPDAKLNTVLEIIHNATDYDGEGVNANIHSEYKALKMYFSNKNEWQFYLKTATELGYLVKERDTNNSIYSLTIKGLSRIVEVLKGKASNVCFVAMAFSKEMKALYHSTIRPTIISCGYEPYIVDTENVDSDKTINDAILAGIKKAKFTIADFTDHRNGVYFEAGFALGRGQKVIYMCKEDHMANSHFDLRNYQHIVWKDTEDLRKKLTDKIEAFIKD